MEQNIVDLVSPLKTSPGAISKRNFTDLIGFPHILKNLPRTLIAFLCTGSLSIFMTAMQAVTDNRAIAAGLHRQAEDPLPDLLMDFAPDSVPMHMADLFLNSLIFFSIVMFLMSWRWRCKQYGLAGGHYRTFRLARKFFWMLACAYLVRSFSLLSTTMPPTDPRCKYKQRNWKEIPFMAFEIMSKQGNTCSDKIFSGHSSMATLICLFWLGALLRPERSQESSESTKISLWRKFAAAGIFSWTLAVYIFCVLCRNHYSIDIVVAILVCTGIYSTYQLSLRIIELLHPQNILKCTSTGDLNFASAWQTQQIAYSPLKNDPEIALECSSPQIEMIQIIPETDNLKPRAPSISPECINLSSNNPKLSYVPRVFYIFLNVIAWMDGIDLKP